MIEVSSYEYYIYHAPYKYSFHISLVRFIPVSESNKSIEINFIHHRICKMMWIKLENTSFYAICDTIT